VYATSVTPIELMPPMVSAVSENVAPVSTSTRRFWPELLTMRRRSTRLLVSMLTRDPVNAVNGSVMSAGSAVIVDFSVATPLFGSTM
jgi:hypothetical protein